ncbi:hypothetical protein C8Q77DRAFT_1103705 [Trametes polyzona]|nr:hypothetical protein C8Q77DRAFT_1103705 [Trametes polyzona]
MEALRNPRRAEVALDLVIRAITSLRSTRQMHDPWRSRGNSSPRYFPGKSGRMTGWRPLGISRKQGNPRSALGGCRIISHQ